ncbi:ELKS/Rab6-interacting/CAST family member 1-like [Haliotis rubra]|uniref:ELKS/Rab6-interacting/CAST family member 1-like n=1 Tax=Haliotis rubra TaxID=36100 RepID=UPI001EE5A67C|nr:ELKS/Rab6-interacting/CAST family member 1-like [Haliotis rubra]
MVIGKASQNILSVADACVHLVCLQVVRAIRKLEHRKKRIRTLIDQLVATCLDLDPHLLEGLPRVQLNKRPCMINVHTMSFEQLLLEVHTVDQESRNLQDYANVLLQRIGSVKPDVLDTFITILESSDESATSCQSN